MTSTDNKRYAEILLRVMLRRGVLQKIGPDEYKVISTNRKKAAAFFQQAEGEANEEAVS